jgi:hypothetical protein
MADIRLKKITVESNQSPLVIQRGDVNITSTTASTSVLNGALVVNGGTSINTTYDASSSTSGGALTVGGGVGVMKNIYVGTDLRLDSSNGVFSIRGLTTESFSTNDRLFVDTISNKNIFMSPDGVNKSFDLTDINLKINITTVSTSSSSGALTVVGGIGIRSTENVINGSNGGALTVAGGVAIGKDLNVSKQILLGETGSNNSGLTVRYTGTDQILLSNSSELAPASINMSVNKLVVGNNSDIEFRTSSGNIKFSNTESSLTMMKINSDNTEFIQPVYISNTSISSNVSSGSFILNGGQTIKSTSESTSVTSGGSFTTLGGMAIGKRTFTGDSVGIDILNTGKRNKLVLYQEDLNLSETNRFTGLGNTGGSLTYQVANYTDSHIFYSGDGSSSNQIFKICGNKDVVFVGKNQSYTVLGGGINSNALSYQSNNGDSSVNFFTYNGVNANNDLCIFGYGLPNDVANSEYLKLGWNRNDYVLSINNIGSGVKQNFVIQSGIDNQIVVKNDGTVDFNSTTESTNSSTGALVIQRGGLSINTTKNATNVSNGGSLTVAGGTSIGGDLILGGDFILNADKPFQYKLSSSLSTSSTYSSLQITSAENQTNTAIHLIADQSVSGSQHSVEISLYNLGSRDNLNNEKLEIASYMSGYVIHSDKAGTGKDRSISIYTGTNDNQLILHTSGNVGINVNNPMYNLDVNGTLNSNNIVTFTSTIESINSTTAALVLTGGISISCTEGSDSLTRGGALTIAGGTSIAKNMVVGGITKFLDSTPSTSVQEAAVVIEGGLSIKSGQNSVNTLNGGGLTVAGGAAITGDLYVGGSINGSGSSSSTYAYLTLTATDDAVNLSSGSLVSLGGLTLQTDTNAINISNGGSILTPGGASIGKDVYIGGNVYMTRGVSNYYTEDNNIINFYDSFNIKRFSIDRSNSTQNFSITRYDSLGNLIEKTLDISNSDGTVVFNNDRSSTSANDSSIVFRGGIGISKTTNATSLGNGGSLTIGGGTSIAKNMFIGGNVVCSSTTSSENVSTGALLVSGGVGVSGNLNVLGNTLIVGNLTVNGQTTSIDTINTSLKDNVFVLNSGPSGSNDSGLIIQRYQQDNNIGSGDVVADSYPATFILPDQSGMTSSQIKLTAEASSINEYYTGWWFKISSGFSNNQVRKIIAYDGDTKIATLSSNWLNQNPSIGDVVNLYNKPYVGVIYNETNDRFEFGSSIQDANQSSVLFTDHIPVCFSKATSVSTEVSNSVSSGSVMVAGGISISNTANASSITRGGTFTTLGGASIGKNLYVGNNLYVNGANMTANPHDMFSTLTFNGANNVSIPSNITGMIFNNSVWGFDCYLSVRIEASTNLFVNFHIRGVNKNSSWEIIKTYVGDDTGIQFNITDFGQIQYTTPNYTSFTSIVFKWRALVNE